MAIASLAVYREILSNRKTVPSEMRRYSENGDESSGDNSRVYCTIVLLGLYGEQSNCVLVSHLNDHL